MLLLEDKELENSVVCGESCISIPFEIFIKNSGEIEILTYSFFKEIALEFESLYRGELSNTLLEWLDENINEKMKKLGYIHVPHEYEYMYEYTIDNIEKLKIYKENKLVKITENKTLTELCKKSDCDIELDENCEDYIFAVVNEEKIISYAGINDLDRTEFEVEISVETSPSEFRKGYGSACVSALCSELLKENYIINYKTSKFNTPSKKLAERCGFELKGIRYSYYCEKV